jgi:hypothetical protein
MASALGRYIFDRVLEWTGTFIVYRLRLHPFQNLKQAAVFRGKARKKNKVQEEQ